MRIDHVYVSDDTAIALNGRPYSQRCCWITRFVDGLIVEVKAYLDSLLVQQVIEGNKIQRAVLRTSRSI